MRKTIFAVLLAIFAVQCLIFAADTLQSRRDAYSGPAPKYIFLCIGDGMGVVQSSAAGAYLAAKNGRVGIDTLALDTLPVYGMTTTYTSDKLITDSAGAGTAFATGCKTNRGTISLSPDGARLETVAERAHAMGMKVGIVTNDPVDHATPAVFYAHQKDRNMFYEISLDLSASGFDYFGGSGFSSPEGSPHIAPGDKSFNTGAGRTGDVHSARNSVEIARERGYIVAEGREAVAKLGKDCGKVVATAGLNGGAALKYAIDCTPSDMTLHDLAAKGIELLDGPDGFFMMIEGGEIDWACHANDAATEIGEVLDFDEAVKLALAFYEKHPDETLVIVTADHETGGMALGVNAMHYESKLALLANQKVSYDGMTSIMKDFRAGRTERDADAALDVAKEYYGLGDASKGLELSPDEKTALETACRDGFAVRATLGADEKARFDSLYGRYDPFTAACCRILDAKAGVGWTSRAHTASPVPLRSVGCGSALFGGFMDDTEIAKNIFFLLEIGESGQPAKTGGASR